MKRAPKESRKFRLVAKMSEKISKKDDEFRLVLNELVDQLKAVAEHDRTVAELDHFKEELERLLYAREQFDEFDKILKEEDYINIVAEEIPELPWEAFELSFDELQPE